MRIVTHPTDLLQTVLLLGMVHHEMADGPLLVYALKLAVAAHRPELAAILRLSMAARIALATRLRHATRKPVQVRFANVKC